MSLAHRLKAWLPPVLLDALRRRRPGNHWHGDFASWAEAQTASAGYEQSDIHDIVERAARRVLAGDGAFERDGVVFTKPEARVGVLSALQVVAVRCGRLRVVDFGGSLASTWIQHRAWLPAAGTAWSVVEQSAFVERGRRVFADGSVRFTSELSESLAQGADAILLSGTLQYLPDPDAWLARFAAADVPFLILDRTAFIPGDRHRLTVQRVDPRIYPGSYPAWFLGRDRVLAELARHGWRIEFTWDCPEDAADVAQATYGGILWSRAGSA
jgi:putative methyltransferase (TIGR04325 family)